jgi:hypothetical protein
LVSIRACEPALVDRPPAEQGWMHEIKHDGFRIITSKQGERVKVWSRRGADFADRFATIAEALRGLDEVRALIDGEAVVLREDGRSDLNALLTNRAARRPRSWPSTWCASKARICARAAGPRASSAASVSMRLDAEARAALELPVAVDRGEYVERITDAEHRAILVVACILDSVMGLGR